MNTRPRLLDLFCKAGGASAGYHAAGFDVVGVDIEPQPDYPFAFVQADALTVDLSGFEVIAASPPCQAFSRVTPMARRGEHPDLIEPVRSRLREAVGTPGGPWAYVIENVPGAPLINPVQVCGDSLRLGVRRHRLFESNLPLRGTDCWHDRPTRAVPVYGTYGQRPARRNPVDVEGQTSPNTDTARAAMGIDWMPWPALTQAIPPAFTFWLGVQLLVYRLARLRSGDGSLELGGTVTASPSGDASPQEAFVTAAATDRICRCGTPLPPRPATGRWPRYCSHACRQAAYRHRQRTA